LWTQGSRSARPGFDELHGFEILNGKPLQIFLKLGDRIFSGWPSRAVDETCGFVEEGFLLVGVNASCK